MNDTDLLTIAHDPDLTAPESARALLALATKVSAGDDDIAGEVIIELTELLRPDQRLRTRLETHPNPPALLTVAAKYAAGHARERAGRTKRHMPLAASGDITELDLPIQMETPTLGLFSALEDLGWTDEHLEALAIPRRRAGRSIHPGIEEALERLASCYGVIERCFACPSPMDLLRLDLRGPDSWPALVPVLVEWGWSDALISHITTSPTNVAHWRSSLHRPPARQERRMIEVARRMRTEPWRLQDSKAVRDLAKPATRQCARIDVPHTPWLTVCSQRG